MNCPAFWKKQISSIRAGRLAFGIYNNRYFRKRQQLFYLYITRDLVFDIKSFFNLIFRKSAFDDNTLQQVCAPGNLAHLKQVYRRSNCVPQEQ